MDEKELEERTRKVVEQRLASEQEFLDAVQAQIKYLEDGGFEVPRELLSIASSITGTLELCKEMLKALEHD